MRELVFRLRGGLWTLLFVMILFMLAPATPGRVCACLLLVTLGQVWRCWSVGYIGLYRGENVKAQALATHGPYSLMRNPLYFGNFIIGLGWSILAGLRGIIIFTLCFYVLYVMAIIPHEEAFLLSKFGVEYEEYCRRVKRFWPAKFRREYLRGKFDAEVVRRSEIHTIISTVIGTIIIIGISLCYT
ncbi:MAG: isoprenylcysteine carboxylmethyltransferase family protein [Synergistaceae bacterium]|nr:isoprenylcysteine carboxylmethyltransferase family protein [Synergistaceae bacterium]